MSRFIIRHGISLIGGTIVSLAALACSSDSDANDKNDKGPGVPRVYVFDAGAGGAEQTGGRSNAEAGDALVNPAPTPITTCGGTDGVPAGGLCVPQNFASTWGNPLAASLPQLECATGEVCAPTVKVRDLTSSFARCQSAASIAGPGYAAGGCLPYYLAAAALPTGVSILTQDTCTTGELCAPCINPLSVPPDQPTGACD